VIPAVRRFIPIDELAKAEDDKLVVILNTAALQFFRDDLQCFKHARYGWPGQSVTHCELHKEEGMVANDRESKRYSLHSLD
jgi:hypothetical protein